MASAFLGYAIKVRFSLYVPLNCTPFKGGEQGDQIGRILAHLVKIYLGQFKKKIAEVANTFFSRLCIKFYKNVGTTFWMIFHKHIWSPWRKSNVVKGVKSAAGNPFREICLKRVNNENALSPSFIFRQGDQVGRIFACWAVCLLCPLFAKSQKQRKLPR
jgi:hypothetical protein